MGEWNLSLPWTVVGVAVVVLYLGVRGWAVTNGRARPLRSWAEATHAVWVLLLVMTLAKLADMGSTKDLLDWLRVVVLVVVLAVSVIRTWRRESVTTGPPA